MAAGDLTPYSTIRSFMGPLDTWLGADDAVRLQAYALYEAIYDNVADAFKLVRQGENSHPVYLPSAKTLIEAKNRFLAKRWTYALDPNYGTTEERAALDFALTNLFRREQVWSKFATQKRYGLIRGDAVWHVVADEEKPIGRRISIEEIDPGSYFPIIDEFSGRVLGCHLVDQVLAASGATIIKRQTYRKTETGTISYELSWWKVGAWDDRNEAGELKRADSKDIPEGDDNEEVEYELDPRITALPVYHVKNSRVPGAPFGKSELAGYETIISGVNQTISDEDLALALEGLGLYFTNSGPPVDDEGNETNWRLGPGWVVEGDEGSDFKRVTGVSTVEPSQAHIEALLRSMNQAAGVPDIAIGKVDTAIAESGISLAFQMGPLLAGNEEKEQEILGVTDHLLYDITTMWLPVFEGIETPARPVSIVDDPLPVNRKAVIDEVLALLSSDPPLISAEYARTILSEKLGYDFPDEMANAVVEEAQAIAAARNQDPFTSRIEQELADGEQQ
jgi:hypothetical protein